MHLKTINNLSKLFSNHHEIHSYLFHCVYVVWCVSIVHEKHVLYIVEGSTFKLITNDLCGAMMINIILTFVIDGNNTE